MNWTGCKCHDACNERFFYDHRRDFERPPLLSARPEDATLPAGNWKARAISTGSLRLCGGCGADSRAHYHIEKVPAAS